MTNHLDPEKLRVLRYRKLPIDLTLYSKTCFLICFRHSQSAFQTHRTLAEAYSDPPGGNMQLAQRVFAIVIAICACQTYALTATQAHEISQQLRSHDDSAIKTCVGDGLMIGQAVYFWKLAHKTDDQIA
ncbi:MAG: hypothetical protein JO142_18090, partial [Burkholderiales bacterium]|nr:hypothetical protein [Burkholderiales bacterium]